MDKINDTQQRDNFNTIAQGGGDYTKTTFPGDLKDFFDEYPEICTICQKECSGHSTTDADGNTICRNCWAYEHD